MKETVEQHCSEIMETCGPLHIPFKQTEWQSKYGLQRIVKMEPHPTGDVVHVMTVGGDHHGEIRIYSVGRIADIMKEQEYELTPEFAEQKRKRFETLQALAQREAEQKTVQDAKESELRLFTDTLTPMAGGKALKTLLSQVRYNGIVTTIGELVKKKISAGETISTFEENRIKPMSRVRFFRASGKEQQEHARKVEEGGKKTVYLVGATDLGKTAFDYAQWLVSQKEELTVVPQPAKSIKPKPAEPVKVTQPVARQMTFEFLNAV